MLAAVVEHRDLRAVGECLFGKDRADMVAHGSFREKERACDLAIVHTLCHEANDAQFALGQVGETFCLMRDHAQIG